MKKLLFLAVFACSTAFGQGVRIQDLTSGSTVQATDAIPVWRSGSSAVLRATLPTIPAAQVNSDWNAVSGVAQILNKPTIPTVTPFNFSLPSARTIAVSTSYQATDTSKAAVIYPSYACQNATTVLAASGCTAQVRVGSSSLTCSTGTVYYTQSLTVSLGLLITQNSTNPVPIFLPAGAHFIICPSVGTFTVTTVEQSAG